jgi:hypothetical protein
LVEWVELRVSFASSVVVVEFGRVDVPIQPASVYSRVVPVLKSQSNRASFLFFFFYFA